MNLNRVLHRIWPWDRIKPRLVALLTGVEGWIKKAYHKRVQALPMDRIRRALHEPARILAGTLIGTVYGPMTAAALGILGTVLPGVIKSYSDIAQAGEHLLLGTLVVAPIITLTLGLVALVIGGVVGLINTVVDGGIGWGLEWSLVAGLGAAIGIGIRYETRGIALLGLAGGAIVGGSVGFLTWLTCTSRRSQPLDLKRGIGYAAGLLLIAASVSLVIG
jgi:hypothetical protein